MREDTAYLAKKKGAVGLVVVLDEGEVLGERKLGNEELVFVDLVVTSVSRSGAEALFGKFFFSFFQYFISLLIPLPPLPPPPQKIYS